MSTTTFNPPKELPTGRRVYPALVIPFGEAVDDAHEDAGRVYSWGDAPLLPRRDAIPVDVDHDGQEVGFATSFVLTRDGIWATLKVGDTGESLVQRGYTAVSAEVDDAGEIIGLSLVRSGRPAFASARIYSPDVRQRVGGFGRMGGSVTVGSGYQAATSERYVPSMFMRDPVSVLPPDPDAEVVRLQEFWRDRVESLREAEIDWEQAIVEQCARDLAEWERQKAAKAVAEEGARAAQEWAERMERLELKAERERLPWWGRLLR